MLARPFFRGKSLKVCIFPFREGGQSILLHVDRGNVKDLFSFLNFDDVDSDFRPEKTFKNSETQTRNRENDSYIWR